MRRAPHRPGDRSRRRAGPGRALLALSLGLFLGLSLSARGQAPAPIRRPVVLKLIPQYLVVSGWWLEVERGGRRQPRQSFTFTPQLYRGPASHPDVATPYYQYQAALEPQRSVRGAGLQVQHRRYLPVGSAGGLTGLYASYGASFQHFVVSYEGMGWQEVRDPNGLLYLEYRAARHAETTNRYGATAQAGYQLPLATGRLVLDVYAGLGWRTGQSRSEVGPVSSQYRSGPSDYGHQGWYFPAGFKLGVAL